MHPSISRGGALAALTTGALVPRTAARAQTLPPLVDVHHHFYPPALLEVMAAWQSKRKLAPVGAGVAGWTPARTLDDMDRSGIALAFVELASPRGVWFDIEPAAIPALSRTCNEFAAGMVRDRPGRFGFFASLPMPDVAASLAEMAYALDTLKADGIGLPTSFGDRWPGERAFAPIYEELDRRRAVVTLHPYAPNCCGALDVGADNAVLEYPYDTGRAVVSLLTGGVFAHYRNIRWVLPHGGGPVPALAGRLVTFLGNAPNAAEFAPNGIDAELKRLYYDTAAATSIPAIGALLGEVAPTQLLFGTDFPYVTGAANARGLSALRLPAPTVAAIAAGNAAQILPRAARV